MIFGLSTITVSAATNKSETYYVTAKSGLNIRAGAGTKYKIKGY